MLVKVHRGGDLLDDAVLHHGDAVAQRQGLDLVVGDVDHRRSRGGRGAGRFRRASGGGFGRRGWRGAHRAGTASGWRTMARPSATRWRWPPESAAGWRSRQAARSRICAASLHPPVDFRPGKMPELQPEGHVLIDRHVRVERVVLEDHGDVAVLGGRSFTTWPLMEIVPSVGSSRPAIRRKVVVLPQPEGPTSTSSSWSSTTRQALSTARTLSPPGPWKTLVRCSRTTCAMRKLSEVEAEPSLTVEAGLNGGLGAGCAQLDSRLQL